MVVRCLCVSALDWRRSDPEKSTCVHTGRFGRIYAPAFALSPQGLGQEEEKMMIRGGIF